MKKIISIFIFCLSLWSLPILCRAMPPGSLVYRSSSDGKMFGYSGDPLIYSEKGIVKNINSGHVGIYIGKDDGIDYVVEALAGGIVKTPADMFVNESENEKYLGAKIPRNLSSVQQAKVVAIAKSLVDSNLAYDFDFKTQKGPESGEWTCVGLAEKLYESANISNPNNLASLEYDPNFYALNITPDGFDDKNIVNSLGDVFSTEFEFSKIAARKDILIPAPEIIGYNVGLENNGSRYIFVPYTQFLQPSLDDVTTDIIISSAFNDAEIRGRVPTATLVLRWSLINNPLSSLKRIAQKTKDIVLALKAKIFGSSALETDVMLTESNEKLATSTKDEVGNNVVITKAISTAKPKKTSSARTAKKSASPVKTPDSATSIVVTKANQAPSSSSAVKTAVAGLKIVETDVKAASTGKSSSSAKVANYYSPPVVNQKPVAIINVNNTSSPAVNNSALKIATINKIYSTGENDWLELYNPGDQDFDLATANYRLEITKTGEDPAIMIRFNETGDGTFPGGTIIKAHGKYLIVKNTANNFYLTKADAVATRKEFSWPGSGYTIYLASDAISSSQDPDIVEAVGFGPDATYFQGEGPAPEIIDNYVLNRIKSTKNNKTDFNLIKSDDPNINWNVSSGDQGTENATTTESTGIGTAIINKIYSTTSNYWIELYNPTDFDLDLFKASYRLEKTENKEDPTLIFRIGDPRDGNYPGGTVIKAKGTYLISSSNANDYYKSKANAIATHADFNWLSTAYSLYLGKGPITSSSDTDIIDLVGFGAGATYWRGINSASAITDNYILNRISNTGDNQIDFNLVKSDDPSIDWNQITETVLNEIYKFSDSAYNLFKFPEPIEMADLKYLWHFDEASGSNIISSLSSSTLNSGEHWIPGKFGAAKEAGLYYENISGELENSINLNDFTMSFWYKQTMTDPRLNIILSNANGDGINMTIESNEMEFAGLENPDWRYFQDFPFDNVWRQATLVINRTQGYWTLYVDGEIKFQMASNKIYPTVDKIELASSNGPFGIDELALISRALSPEEVIELRRREAPFAPVSYPENQKKPELKHFWNFNEGIGTTTKDLVTGASLALNEYGWFNIDETNSAIINTWDKTVNINFEPLQSSDLSLSFWWKVPDIYNGHRARFTLMSSSTENILSLIPSVDYTAYNLYDNFGYYSYGRGLTIPADDLWHYLALVYDSYRNLLNFYVDGVEMGTRDFVSSANRPLADTVEIVAENGLTLIDDLAVWEGALSQMQIQEILTNN